MKILLVNDNPVVNRLVTLSAQKTSDELEVVSSIEEILQTKYDLLIIDDTLFNEEFYRELNKKIEYTKSLYICSRDAKKEEGFTQILKKPFLPTDLVEIFSMLAKEAPDEDFETTELEEFSDAQEKMILGEPVLDDDEAQKVKDLLDETEEEIEELEEFDLNSLAEELSQEELESEVDEETLFKITENDIDSLDGLTSRDMKIALGEEPREEFQNEVKEELEEVVTKEEITDEVITQSEHQETPEGVEVLKNLLTALSDKNVAASMKGMKISINITLGDS